jgi:hypothetical protein
VIDPSVDEEAAQMIIGTSCRRLDQVLFKLANFKRLGGAVMEQKDDREISLRGFADAATPFDRRHPRWREVVGRPIHGIAIQ